MEGYRGKAQNLDKFNIMILLIGLVITVIGCMILGIFSRWVYILILIPVYIVFGLLSNKISKHY